MTGKSAITLAVFFLGLQGGAALAQSSSGGPLLQPGEPYPGTQQGQIQLHMPAKQPSAATDTTSQPAESGATASTESGATDSTTLTLHMPRHKRAPAAQIANTQAPSSGPVTIPFSLDESAPTSGSAPSPGSGPTARHAVGHAQTRPATPARVAATAGANANDHLTKRGVIQFEKGAPAPSPAQYRGLKVLASDLNSALESGASMIQLDAYGGAPGDKSSDARRLSLQRALSVRQLLIDDGVPSGRIDVRALGGSDDKGPADRVDVFIRAG